MPNSEIAFFSAAELRRLMGRRELSPVDVVQACLDQVERRNGTVNALVTLNPQAIDEARRLESASEKGLLYGLPVGIKDVTPTAGLRTTYGSPLYRDHVPQQDGLIVQRLKQAGAIVLGKTNVPEFAAGGNTFNQVFGPTRNPWDVRLTAGGSTGGGAAALAAGMIALADGTDLGGSLRMPASFCGVVGLRPSPGLVPTVPSDYLWDTLQVSGGLGRSVEDVALFLQATAGPSPFCPLSQPVKGRDFVAAVQSGIPRRLAYCPDIARIGIDPDVESVCRQAAFELSQAGASIEETDLDLSFARSAFLALRGYWMVAHHRQRIDSLGQMGSNLAGNIRAGLKLEAQQLGQAEQDRSRLWQTMAEFFEDFDLLLTPTMAVPPFPVEQNFPESIAGKPMQTYVDWFAPTFVLSLTSLPVASVPCGLDSQGLPVGLQIAGPPLGEEKVLALGKKVQEGAPRKR